MINKLVVLTVFLTVSAAASKFVYFDSKMNKTTKNPQIILEMDNLPKFLATWNDKIVTVYNGTLSHISHSEITMPSSVVHSVVSNTSTILYTLMTSPSSIDIRPLGAGTTPSNIVLNQTHPMTEIAHSPDDMFLATFDNTPIPKISIWELNKTNPLSIKLNQKQNISDIIGNITSAKFCNEHRRLVALANSTIYEYTYNQTSNQYQIKGSYPLSSSQTILEVSSGCDLLMASGNSSLELMHHSHQNGNYIRLPNVAYSGLPTPIKMMRLAKDASWLAIVLNNGDISQQSRTVTGNPTLPATCNYTYSICLYNCNNDVLASVLNGFQISCTCVDKYIWSEVYGRCQINCDQQQNQQNNATQCTCLPNFIWNESAKKCQLICRADNLTIGFNQTTGICDCAPGATWNNFTFMCQRNCTNFPNAIGDDLTNSSRCVCISNYTWRDETSSCAVNCTDITRSTGWVSDMECRCNLQYVWNASLLKCVVNCQKFNLAMPNPLKIDECLCPANYTWTAWPNGCMINCSLVNGSIIRGMAQVCTCPYKMSMIYGACRLDCRKISYTTTSNGGSACNCIAGYTWDDRDKICKRKTNWVIILGLIVPLIILGIVGLVFCLISCKKGIWRRQFQGPSRPAPAPVSAFDQARPDIDMQVAQSASHLIKPQVPVISVSQVRPGGPNLVEPYIPQPPPFVSSAVRENQLARPPSNEPFGYFNNNTGFKPGTMGVVGGPPLLTGSNVFAPTNNLNRAPPRPPEDLLRFSNVMPVQAPSTIPLPPSTIPAPPSIPPRPQVVMPPPPPPLSAENLRKLVEPRQNQEAPLSPIPAIELSPPAAIVPPPIPVPVSAPAPVASTVVVQAPVVSSPRSPKTPPPERVASPRAHNDEPMVGPPPPASQSPRTSPRQEN